jgi:hypothetical protein
MGTTELRTNILRIIHDFIYRHKEYLDGRTLDYGCGLEPYKDLVSGEYVPYDEGYVAINHERHYEPYSGHFQTTMLIDVLACFIDPRPLLKSFDTDYLLITSTACWHEACKYDLSRFTLNGLRKLLKDSGYEIMANEVLGTFNISGVDFPQHHGILARKL